ncbi:MAG: HutD family protein [Kofleriaceae bacterium]|nr:HutD family protein [Kofleriaceae bacterium]
MSKVLTPRDWIEQPWRNSGGTTYEILRRSARGDVDDYDLRLSVADVARSGPFSTFPGYRRWSFLADTAPITLAHETAIELVTRGDHIELPGTVSLTATLPAGPTHLFNILARIPLVAGFGPSAHPVDFMFALAHRDDLARWELRSHDKPTATDTTSCVWIVLGR